MLHHYALTSSEDVAERTRRLIANSRRLMGWKPALITNPHPEPIKPPYSRIDDLFAHRLLNPIKVARGG